MYLKLSNHWLYLKVISKFFIHQNVSSMDQICMIKIFMKVLFVKWLYFFLKFFKYFHILLQTNHATNLRWNNSRSWIILMLLYLFICNRHNTPLKSEQSLIVDTIEETREYEVCKLEMIELIKSNVKLNRKSMIIGSLCAG